MQIEKECSCCGSIYSIVWTRVEDMTDWPDDLENQEDEDNDSYPEFCPFCGRHEGDEGSLDDDE
jgi:hypothetical protein